MSFTELLIFFAFTLFASATLLLRLVRAVKNETHLKPKPRAKWLFSVYSALTGILFVLSAYYVITGQRPFIWFCVFALVGTLSLYFANSAIDEQYRFSVFAVILLAVVQSSMPIIQNRGIIFGADQWRDLKVTTSIIDTGTFENALGRETGFYAFVPLFSVINAAVSQIAGCSPMAAFAIMQGVLCLLSAISVHAIMMKLSGHVEVSFIAVMLLLSTPRLATIEAIPSLASISLGFLSILLFVKEEASFLRNILLIMAMLALNIVILHPMGIFPILGICLGIVVISHFSIQERLSTRAISFTKRVFVVCFLIALAYWNIDYGVFSDVFNPLERFLLTLTRFRPSTYSPIYQSTGFELFSFSWALPIAFSAAYLVSILRSDKGVKHRLSRDLSQHVVTVSALVGLLLILGAFISVISSPGAGVERYISVPGYALLILSSSFVFGQLLLSRRKAAIVFAVLLFSTNLVIGSSSPDWAPFENPTFGAFRSTATSFTEANVIANFLPNNTRLFEDHDISFAGATLLRKTQFITEESYQTTRNVIQKFKDNSFAPFDPEYDDAVIVIKTDEIVDRQLFDNYVNILYNSERHVVVAT